MDDISVQAGSHLRRGDQMSDRYWERFMISGRVNDYLSYKNARSGGQSRAAEKSTERQTRERSGAEDGCTEDGMKKGRNGIA